MLSEQLTELQMYVDMAKVHIGELQSGKKAASAKARSALQKGKAICQSLRKECMEQVKNIPVKSRVKVAPVEPPVVETPVPAVEPPVVETPVPSVEPPAKRKKTKRKTK